MSENESKLKEENEFIKELLNFNGGETRLKHLKEMITNNQNGPNYFISFLDHYSKCRPNQHHVSKELIKCVYSCFPEQINKIQQVIKKNTVILKFIIFPEEFPIKRNKEQKKYFHFFKKMMLMDLFHFFQRIPYLI